ncbi:HypC/HybG/HupF family hydrogenase formation chaperone [Microbacterium sp. bgisy207]|jgi:hydrogenase expression/formation protein HypC|uniref:HypC/HybG/HupF family hydrogenase formation chaperone n=1 Tax=Microbacterium sp. bgisy207 TaxID=3413800 RepID=UPI003EBAF496
MCLAIPGRILERWEEPDGAIVAEVDFAGETRDVKLNFLPDLQVGDYVIVHAGFALTRVPADQVDQVMSAMQDAGIVDDDGAIAAEARVGL